MTIDSGGSSVKLSCNVGPNKIAYMAFYVAQDKNGYPLKQKTSLTISIININYYCYFFSFNYYYYCCYYRYYYKHWYKRFSGRKLSVCQFSLSCQHHRTDVKN